METILSQSGKPHDHILTTFSYDIPVLASFAGVNIDLWEQYCEANGEESPPANRDWLGTQYSVLAHHLYREVLRYRKYLVFNKYRNPKK